MEAFVINIATSEGYASFFSADLLFYIILLVMVATAVFCISSLILEQKRLQKRAQRLFEARLSQVVISPDFHLRL